MAGEDVSLKPGQLVYATVLRPVNEGYSLLLGEHHKIGFLKSQRNLMPGDSLMVDVVSIGRKTILVKEHPAQIFFRSRPHRFIIRRAIDLMPPPSHPLSPVKFPIGEYKPDWLIADIEQSEKTGCLVATCPTRMSRAAMLMYKGRGVGAVYGCFREPETRPTPEAISSLLSDLNAPDTMVTLYDLPDPLVLSLSALFIGQPLDYDETMNAIEYYDHISSWLKRKGLTATFAFSPREDRSTVLAFVFQGKYIGSFWVEAQLYEENPEFPLEMLKFDPAGALAVSILPEKTMSSASFGFRLSQL